LQSLTFYKGSQQSIHVDYPYVRCQTQLAKLAASWIPLEDIHPESGPLVYYPGSHKTEISDFLIGVKVASYSSKTVSVSPTNCQFIWLSG
jgi:ectoine hydroxylase-related dioxygenase (phytanoyl-CoA dioxygenase family)